LPGREQYARIPQLIRGLGDLPEIGEIGFPAAQGRSQVSTVPMGGDEPEYFHDHFLLLRLFRVTPRTAPEIPEPRPRLPAPGAIALPSPKVSWESSRGHGRRPRSSVARRWPRH